MNVNNKRKKTLNKCNCIDKYNHHKHTIEERIKNMNEI